MQTTVLLTWEISTKLIFLLLWLQRQAHVHFDLGFVAFDKFFQTLGEALAELGQVRQTLQIPGRNEHVLAAAATAAKI